MKPSELLRKAREELCTKQSGDYCFGICGAISRADYLHNSEAWSSVHETIRRRLGLHIYLQDWIAAKLGVPVSEITNDPERLRATRLAWIDSLIEEFEARGE